jgi:hypothetical protein
MKITLNRDYYHYSNSKQLLYQYYFWFLKIFLKEIEFFLLIFLYYFNVLILKINFKKILFLIL